MEIFFRLFEDGNEAKNSVDFCKFLVKLRHY